MNSRRPFESGARAPWTLVALLALAATHASAQAGEPPTPSPVDASSHASGIFGAALRMSNEGGGLGVDARIRLPRGTQLGVLVASDYLQVAHVGGLVTHGAATAEFRLLALIPLVRSPRVELDLRLSSGLRFLRDVGSPVANGGDATRSATEIALLAHVQLGERLLLRVGALVVVELEIRPTTELADQMQLLSVGLGAAVGPRSLLYGTVDAGGSYGFNGDNGKVVVRAEFGLRVPLAHGPSPRTAF